MDGGHPGRGGPHGLRVEDHATNRRTDVVYVIARDPARGSPGRRERRVRGLLIGGGRPPVAAARRQPRRPRAVGSRTVGRSAAAAAAAAADMTRSSPRPRPKAGSRRSRCRATGATTATLIDGFTAKYGIKINGLNPGGGSKDEIDAIKANKNNPGPQAPDVVDVGLAFGPQGVDRGPLPAVQGLDLGHHPGLGQGRRRHVVRRLLRRHVVRGQHQGRDQRPEGLGRPAQARVQEQVALAGDPRASNQAIQAVWASALRQRRQRSTTPSQASTSSRSSTTPATSCRSSPSTAHRRQRRRRRSASRWTYNGTGRQGQPQGQSRRSTSSSRRPAASAACTSRPSASTRRTRTPPSCGWSTCTPTRASTSG